MQLFVSINTIRIYHECEDGIKISIKILGRRKNANLTGHTMQLERLTNLKTVHPYPLPNSFFCGGWGGGGYKKYFGGIKISEKLDMYYSLKGG